MKLIFEFLAFVLFFALVEAACEKEGFCMKVNEKRHCLKLYDNPKPQAEEKE